MKNNLLILALCILSTAATADEIFALNEALVLEALPKDQRIEVWATCVATYEIGAGFFLLSPTPELEKVFAKAATEAELAARVALVHEAWQQGQTADEFKQSWAASKSHVRRLADRNTAIFNDHYLIEDPEETAIQNLVNNYTICEQQQNARLESLDFVNMLRRLGYITS